MPRQSIFEQIRQEDNEGNEYWSSRKLATALGYRDYQVFPGVIQKAKIACDQSGQNIADHFRDATDMIEIGKGGHREVESVHLSRYACYLVVQNADPRKPAVARGQTYFAIRTRHDELSEQQTLEDMTEDERRLVMRQRVTDGNLDLQEAAHEVGVITAKDFAIFNDHGYKGLYDGETAQDIAARKGLHAGHAILDHMGSEELAANWFRITQTDAKLRRDGIQEKEAANATHQQVGQVVRQAIADLGGTMPENLPTPRRSIQQVKRDQKRRQTQGDDLFSIEDIDHTTE